MKARGEPVTAEPMTRRQHDVLDLILGYSIEHGRVPTLRRIAESMGLALSTVHGHVEALVVKGRLRRTGRNLYPSYALAESSCTLCGRRTGTDTLTGAANLLGKILAGIENGHIADVRVIADGREGTLSRMVAAFLKEECGWTGREL